MILTCGEALIDLVPGPDGTPVPHPGGAALNSAVAMGRLGASVGLVAGLSYDKHGQFLRRTLEESHVDLTHVMWSERPTTLAKVSLNDGVARYRFEDQHSAGRMIAPADLPIVSSKAKALCYGGISLIHDPGAETLMGLIEATAPQCLTYFDPNIRPGFVKDEKDYRARLNRAFACAQIAKVSDEDLAWLFPKATSPTAAIAKMHELGPSLILHTRGAANASAYLKRVEVCSVPAPDVTVVDTVGAGDTFTAGFLTYLQSQGLLTCDPSDLAERGHIVKAMSLGVKAASYSVTRAGANPPRRAEIASV